MKYALIAFIIMSILGVCILGRKIYKYLIRGLEKIKIIRRQLEEIFYLESKNNQLLAELSMNTTEQRFSYVFDDSWCKNNHAICHALGEIDGVLFTECKEAFEKHYREGYRRFELDLALTSDRKAVVIHDWNTFNKGQITSKQVQIRFNSDKILTEEEFANTKVLGKYTTLTMERFVKLANQYDDAYFIISVKSVNQQYNDDVRTIFDQMFHITDSVNTEIRKRYILHVYSFEFLHRTMKEYMFHSVIYRMVNAIHPLVLAEELKKCGITTITTLDIIYIQKGYCRIMNDNGIKIIGCVVARTRDMKVKKWIQSDVDMIMTPISFKEVC